VFGGLEAEEPILVQPVGQSPTVGLTY
jgi:hypothetical protein